MADDHRSLEEIEAIIASGDFEHFVHEDESVVFEAKAASPYDLSLPSRRWELAKDVSSFANAGGGVIVVGLETDRSESRNAKRVVALSLVDAARFTGEAYLGVVRRYVDPKIEGLTATWHASRADATRGVGVIRIPRQVDDAKPFFLKQLTEEGEVRELVFGIVTRHGDSSVPMTLPQLRQAVRTGSAPVPARLARIEEQLAALNERVLELGTMLHEGKGANVAPAPDPLDARIDRALHDD